MIKGKHDPISKIGEKGLIRMILKEIDNSDVLVGNDDAVGILLEQDSLLVVNIDTLFWPTDIPTNIKMTLRQGGRKTVIMAVSDLGAKGVKPRGFISSIGVPPKTRLRDVLELVRGMREGAAEYGMRYLGGDLSESRDTIISGVTFGVACPQNVMTRSGAKVGDKVFLTGEFLTGAGLKIAVNDLSAPVELKRTLVRSVTTPKARVREGIALGRSGIATACIDSSDGLVRSLFELAEASQVGIRVHHLPIPESVRKFAKINKLNPEQLVLYGGEEYELVFTIHAKMTDMITGVFQELGSKVTQIGEVIRERKILLGDEELDPTGYEHFVSR
ncbi:MAG: thiamine-phosphate kinase [Candidatus Heimdallarchaeota archaeon]